MKQKVALISLALIGFVFVFSGSAWANGNHRQGRFYGKPLPHHGYYAGKGPGWRHGLRHHPKRFHRGPWHRGRQHRPVHRTVEKHVYHHYNNDTAYDTGDQYEASGSLSDPGFSFSFGVSGTR